MAPKKVASAKKTKAAEATATKAASPVDSTISPVPQRSSKSTPSPAPTRPSSSIARTNNSGFFSVFSANQQFLIFAAIAGSCGALSGVCGKVGVSSSATLLTDFIFDTLQVYLNSNIVVLRGSFAIKFNDDAKKLFSFYIEYAVRIFMFVANVFFTGQMWRFYLKALNLGPTTVAQVVNTAANFVVSAFVGVMLFGEQIGILWLVGASIAAVGLYLLIVDSNENEMKKKQKNK